VKLDKSSFVPLYRQLISVFYHRIHEGIYPLHSLLPSQKDVAKEFDISLIVVRQAWQEMINEKIIVSQRGYGSIVSKLPDETVFMHSLNGLTHDTGKAVTHEIMAYSESENNVIINNHFPEVGGQGYIYLKRLRFINGVSVSIENNYLNKNIIIDFKFDRYIKSASLYTYLMEETGLEITYADEKIRAIVADKDVAKTLSISVGTPLLSVIRKTYCQNGMFEYTEYIIKSEFYGSIRYNKISE
ncbi:HTH-type transcriptional repressor YvoA, partial [Klebsiella pneumoniae]